MSTTSTTTVIMYLAQSQYIDIYNLLLIGISAVLLFLSMLFVVHLFIE